MSLISQRDREITISALENYINTNPTEYPKSELSALLNWIKLEHTKNK